MELKLGKMSGREIAEWLGISYNSTYRNNPTKQIEKLFGYCEYEQVRGGIIIKEIYKDTYCGDLMKKTSQDYLAEIKEKKNKLSSVAGMARKFIADKEEYANTKQKTLEYQLRKAGEVCFGKTNYEQIPENFGAYGYKTAVWAIKIDDYNNYRYFRSDEMKMFDEILDNFYGKDKDKVKKLALLDKAFKKDEISKEEYFHWKEELDLDFFGQCVRLFRERTGLIVARVQAHQITEREGAF